MTLVTKISAVATGLSEERPVVCVEHLAKSYGGPQILRDVSFSLQKGVSLAIIGANGSGKSTLLKTLIRLTEPSAGSIRILDQDVCALSGSALRRFRSLLGVVWQRHNLVPRLCALSNVVHGVQSRQSGMRSWWQSIAPQAVRAEALECLDRVGMADFALRRVDSLSGGQSQRVAIARMLMQRPELILADEPDASLDPQSGEDVMRLLSDLARQQGISLIFVSHRLEHTLQFSDQILGLLGGELTLNLPTSAAHAEQLRRFFETEE